MNTSYPPAAIGDPLDHLSHVQSRVSAGGEELSAASSEWRAAMRLAAWDSPGGEAFAVCGDGELADLRALLARADDWYAEIRTAVAWNACLS